MPTPLSRYVAEAARPLPALAELAGAPEALAPLSAMVGDARIVAIGESFHHTHEQLVLRDHLVRHLVEQLGFNTILLEVITPGGNSIDAFVRHGAGKAENALIAAGARMWRNHETASLLRWLRAHNGQTATRQVAVQGLDVLAIGPLIRSLCDPAHPAHVRLTTLSEGFNIDGRSDQAAYNQLAAKDRDELHALASDALAREPTNEAALVLSDALAMLKVGANGWIEGFALRDAAMANAASRAIDRGAADDKFIILSHNTHVATLASTTEPAHPPMGAFLRERYGDAYFVLGAAFGRARFEPPIYGVGAFEGDASCIDQNIATLGAPTALLDLRRADQDHTVRLQGVGIGPLPYTEYPALNAFDALAYVDVLTNARQLIETELGLDPSAVDASRT